MGKQNINISKHFSWLAILCFEYRKDESLGNLNDSGVAMQLLWHFIHSIYFSLFRPEDYPVNLN